MNKGFLVVLVLVAALSRLSAQEWVVPADESGRLSPFAFSDSTRKAGNDLYNLNCKSCHGDPGKNNPVKLVPPPPDPASAQMQKNNDGSMFYKVSTGRGPMPSFKNTMTTTDVWKVISFIRSFDDKYVQEVAKKSVLGAVQGVKMLMTWNAESRQVQVLLTYMKEGIRQTVVGADMKLFVQRYFGNLPVDGTKTTDNLGIARFNFPKDLPGDAKGIVKLTARPVDEATFGEAKADTVMAIGVATYRPPLNEPRAIWNVVSKTPIWLLLSYTLSVLAVWGMIFFVALQIRKIFKSGSK